MSFTKAKCNRIDLELGTFVPVQNDKIAKLISQGDDLFQQIALGRIPGVERFSIVGHTLSQSVSDGIIEVTNLSVAFPYKTVDAKLSIVSDNVADTILGTGLQKLFISGVNAALQERSEIVDMDGTNDFLTVNDYIFANILKGDDVGSNLANIGKITATHSGDVIAAIDPIRGRSQHAVFFIPEGKVALIDKITANSIKRQGQTGTVEATVLFQGGEFGKSFVTSAPVGISSNAGGYESNMKVPVFFDEKSAIRVMAEADANNTSISVRMDLILIDKALL